MQKKTFPIDHECRESLLKILDVFSYIDLKIIDLHKCSSDDFMSLNNALKDNYKKASEINDITSATFNKIGESGNINSFKLIKQDFARLKKQVGNIEKKVDTSLNYLDNIRINLNMIEVPLNNFIQNICVLKLMLTNVKLADSFFDNLGKSRNKESNKEIEAKIKTIKKDFQPIVEDISKLENFVQLIHDNLTAFKDNHLASLLCCIESVLKDIEVIEKHNNTAIDRRAELDELVKQCYSNVESIITNLQYHDIIRQKMEHVQKTHQLIVEELNNFDDVNNKDKDASKILSYVTQIPQISEIQTAQLMHANKEFQQAIDHITSKMNDIGQNISSAAKTYDTLAVFKHNTDVSNLGRTDVDFNNIMNKCSEGYEKLKNIHIKSAETASMLTDSYEEILRIDSLDNTIEQIVIEKITRGGYVNSESEEMASKAQLIVRLYADNRFEKNKLKTILIQSLDQLDKVIKNSAKLLNQKQGLCLVQNIADSAYQKIVKVKDVFKYLDNNKKLVQQKSREVLEQNKSAIKEAKYYTYFEKTIDEIVDNFNQISDIIEKGKIKDVEIQDKNSLKRFEEYYTMKTERVIHNKTLSDLLETKPGTQKNKNEDDDNDVEFF